jgi:hypothetical protein
MSVDAMLSAAEIRLVYDRQQISEALYIYCRAVDRVDRELGYTIWHDDAKVDYGDAIYCGSGRGVIDYICDSHLKGVVHSHQITNIIFKFDSEYALTEAYVTSGMRMMLEGELTQVTTRGRYLDRWSRSGGPWRIERRYFVGDFDDVRTAKSGSIPPRFKLDRSDPSYAWFEGTI